MIRRISLAIAIGVMAVGSGHTQTIKGDPVPTQTPIGPWQLVPIQTLPAPAAWVFDTATGSAFLCMVPANDKKAGVSCQSVNFPKQESPK